MPARSKKGASGLGKAIQNAKVRQRHLTVSDLHTTEEVTLQSDWQSNDLEEFLTRATQSDRDFTAERNIALMVDGTPHVFTEDVRLQPMVTHDEAFWHRLSRQLTIPRRPPWTHDMAKKDVIANEKRMFVEWRRTLSRIEEKAGVVMTPFEKNLEVWRQLWRVVERSDVVMVILDARNPMMFRSTDLEKYITSHPSKGPPKRVLLLLNKADFLTKKQRLAWAHYLKGEGIESIFFSAVLAEAEIEAEKAAAAPVYDSDDDDDDDDDEDDDEDGKDSKPTPASTDPEKKKEEEVPVNPYPHKEDASHILTRQELVAFLQHQRVPGQSTTMVGMVGYPNVGKSSTINALMGEKRVVVGATPGKTKHFQTLVVNPDLTLCDCPGLVFPSFANTKEGMVLDGILPIEQLRDWRPPAEHILARIPREVLEMRYGIDLDLDEDTDAATSFAEFLLNQYSRAKGYMTDHNKPNMQRAIRDILRDYVNGKILYVHPPPKSTGADGEVQEDDGDEDWLTDDDDEDVGDDEEEEEEGEEEDGPTLGVTEGGVVEEPSVAKRDGAFNDQNVNLDPLFSKFVSRKKKKKRRQHQEVDPSVKIDRDGNAMLTILDDDCIVEYGGGGAAAPSAATPPPVPEASDPVGVTSTGADERVRPKTKRQLRGEQRSMLKHAPRGPVKSTTGVVGYAPVT